MSDINYEKLDPHVFVTKLAGFEHSEYIQPHATHEKVNSSDIPMVQGKNIRNGIFVKEYDWYINENISNSLPRSVLNKPCILIPYVGSNLGEVGIFYNHERCHLASNIAKVELIDNKYDLEYLKYYLQSPLGQKYLFKEIQGSSQPNITMQSIRDTLIIQKDLEEQCNIAKTLLSIDKKIENNRKINENLQQMASAIYFHMFFKKKPNAKLGDIIVENKKSSIQVGDTKISTGNYPFFTSGSAILKWNEKLVSGRNCFLNTGGNSDIKFYVGDAAYSTDTWCITAKNNLSDYLYLLLKSIKNELNIKFFQGTGLKHLQKPLLKLRDIYLPNESELTIFNNYVRPILSMVSHNTCQSETLSALRDWLLPMLMNGQATISD